MAFLLLRAAGNYKYRVHSTRSTAEFDSSSTVESGECTIQPIGNPEKAIVSRLKLIDGATRSIDFQYYVHASDGAGNTVLSALIDAARRGVKVRMLLDDIALAPRECQLTRLVETHTNLQIRIFNPTLLRKFCVLEIIARFPRANRRMHNKSLTIDSVTSIVGGRNIADEYYGDDDEVYFADHDVLITGHLAAEITGQFNEYWTSGIAFDVEHVGGKSDDVTHTRWLADVHKSAIRYREKCAKSGQTDPDTLKLNSTTESQFVCSNCELVYDPPDKILQPLTSIESSYVVPRIEKLLRSANQKILLASPYLVPGDSGLELLKELRIRNIEITAFTNSFATNDVWIVNAGYLDYRKKLLSIGVKVFELKPQICNSDESSSTASTKSLHAKAIIVDHERVFIGSLNLDPRSALHNTEMGVIFDHPGCAGQIESWIESHLSTEAYEVSMTADNKLQWSETTTDGIVAIYDQDPGISWLKRKATYLASWIPVEWML